jgi:hypothetical protein
MTQKLTYHLFILIFFSSFLIKNQNQQPVEIWGWFGHKRINRLAVFTLPSDMMPLFKKEIEYITENAVAPDKRRFVSATEGYRHYINLDRWSFLPRDVVDARILHTDIFIITDKNDTLLLIDYQTIRKQKRDYILKSKAIKKLFLRDSIAVADSFFRKFFIQNLIKIQPDENHEIEGDSLKTLFFKERFQLRGVKSAYARDKLTVHGVLPYNLIFLQRQLTDAFIQKKKKKILKIAAEIGHYLADAHVPLHTTSNYDGQMTNQNGIHAFWESRLPELFADNQYDFFVGRAEYFHSPRDFYWDIIYESNKLISNVLKIEKDINGNFPSDKKYCPETVNGVVLQKPCFEYAEAYHDKLNGMVEEQMQKAILAIGSAWYTAWVDAGQPDLSDFKSDDEDIDFKKEEIKADSIMTVGGKMIGRPEDN